MRVVLTDGQTHVVDSSEMAFKIAAQYAFREAFNAARPNILEPMMKVGGRRTGRDSVMLFAWRLFRSVCFVIAVAPPMKTKLFCQSEPRRRR